MAEMCLYVPAYERPHTLARLLGSIPDDPRVRIVVSDDSPHHTSRPVCDAYPYVEYSARNYRCDRDANVLRGLAVSQETWTWIVGDDDYLLPGALDKVFDFLDDDTDRLILHSKPSARLMPANILGKHLTDHNAIEAVRNDPSMLIATTLCTTNIYRTSKLNLAEGMRHFDTYYSLGWATLDCHRWHIAPDPLIGVGTEPTPTITDHLRHWQDLLDGMTAAADVDPIPVSQASGWNFVSAERYR